MFCLLTFAMGRQMSNPTQLSKKSGIHHRRCPKDRAHAVKLASPVAGGRWPVAGKGNLPGDRLDADLGL
jgi:hypothetical protein